MRRSLSGPAMVSREQAFESRSRASASLQSLPSLSSSSSFIESSLFAPVSSRGDFSLLQQDIEQFLLDELPGEDHKKSVSGFIRKLETQIQEHYPDASLKMHGSGACGLATKTSDVDLVLSGVEQDALMPIFRRLSQHYPDGCAEGVFSAKIPIIRILDPDSGQDADISVAEKGAPNVDHDYRTKLLRCYTILDPRVIALIILVKKWSKLREIGEARFGFLGSFGYSLSVINYLQSISPPVLPCLHVKRTLPSGILEPFHVMGYREYIPIESFRSKNTQSVALLLLGYFEWFSGLPLGTAGTISVRCGGVVNGSFVDMEVQKQKRCLCIEDPYQPDLNVGKGVSMEKALIIKREFKLITQYMKDSRTRIRLRDLMIPAPSNPRAPFDRGKASARAWSQRKRAYREESSRRQRSPVKISSFDEQGEAEDNKQESRREEEEESSPYGPSMKSTFKRYHPYSRPSSSSSSSSSLSSLSSLSSQTPFAFSASASASASYIPAAYPSSSSPRIQTLSSRFSQQYQYSSDSPTPYSADQREAEGSRLSSRFVQSDFSRDTYDYSSFDNRTANRLSWTIPATQVKQSNPNRRVVLRL